ncbi:MULTISPECIES: ferrous iron transport protein B [unclassified Methylophilus]|uniref:ferrous iron transport protein B n=1 Tax=unclassified Methylophilus TaxID=2630143 RepID=UPI00188F0ECE|nr:MULTISPECIES: ferrous iron transport protein B [unclassified Methylophilus]MBF5039241.1 ferrous iron transport protein B [Methylophilus sp. 13]MDF0377406.1 ferrous iron transport protein B [Methylophilus sp. YYY-1]MDT7849478.1 ferrous iron transport protein B [Methylophilus sp. VKM B-3414]BEV08684.1 ferrous iron transport protein B [Methylophilus sp. DW102]
MKRVALLGMPNTGKSTLFNRLSGASARVGNWPGITVDLMSAKLLLGGHIAELIDLPGLYDLHGFSDDEHVVRHFLSHHQIDLVLIILNSAQIDRQLSLALQIRALGLPAVLLLNMEDEAKRAGITINTQAMSKQLGMPVRTISAKYGQGCPEALQLAAETMLQHPNLTSPDSIARKLELENAIEQEMHHIIDQSVQFPIQLNHTLTDRLDKVLLHPWFGLPLFLLSVFLLFQFIFSVGAPLQEGMGWLFDTLRSQALEPALAFLPGWLNGLLLDGLYTGFSTVAAFVPIIVLFFLVMSMVEDSGYLSRAAFLMDTLMAKMGLDGRGFVMMLMGFGCNVPALMGTRVMRSRPMRLLTMLTIPLSLCSARLQVFLFIIAILFPPSQAALVLFSLYLVSFATIFITAVLFKRSFQSREPFVLELPPYRFPTPQQIWMRGWQEVKHFLARATKFIVIGVVLVWLLTHLPFSATPASPETWAGSIGRFFAPVLDPIGIDTQLAIALIFGFVAKEIVVGSLAVIYGLQGDALSQQIASNIDWVQGMSFMLFTLIYTPCLSTIATLKSESKSSGFMWLSLAWSLMLAWLVSFAFYQTARALGY